MTHRVDAQVIVHDWIRVDEFVSGIGNCDHANLAACWKRGGMPEPVEQCGSESCDATILWEVRADHRHLALRLQHATLTTKIFDSY